MLSMHNNFYYLVPENTNQKGTNYKWETRKASNILSDLAQGKSVWGYPVSYTHLDVYKRQKQNYPEFVKQYLKYNQRKGKEIG